eukprot:TRINITY_DN17081_c0_g1_i1.p1 TRINITY_DN17081_c0_g1~~TRINITY_DN17081_c0_g1_i1.p1  ORF type:complete len:375 (-),score=55.40 TRINITY_DN17081_c0_g1_i1:353-1420(-)
MATKAKALAPFWSQAHLLHPWRVTSTRSFLLATPITWQQRAVGRRLCSSATRDARPEEDDDADVPPPTPLQIKRHFIQSAVPMVAFGFMDNSVMIHAGNAIDLTLGVTFGLSTLAAAACGQICSDIAGVTFGGLISTAANSLGLPSPDFTTRQQNLPHVKRVGIAGNVLGVFCGCSLGLVNLLLVDTNKARQLKLNADIDSDVHGLNFEVSMDNVTRPGQTCVTIKGPDASGVIASLTSAMAMNGCKIQEMSGDRRARTDDARMCFKFFLTVDDNAIDDDDLEQVGQSFVDACNHPQRIRTLFVTNETLKKENVDLKSKCEDLQNRLAVAEARIARQSVTITKKDGTCLPGNQTS